MKLLTRTKTHDSLTKASLVLRQVKRKCKTVYNFNFVKLFKFRHMNGEKEMHPNIKR